MKNPPQASVIIAHRNHLLCEVLREALQHRNFQVLAYGTTAADADRLVMSYQPDIMIMSNDLLNGAEVISKARAKGIESKFLILSQNEEEAHILHQQGITAEGHLHAWVKMSEFFYCLQELISNRTYVSSVIDDFIIEAHTDNGYSSGKYDPLILNCLTPREKEIMKALSKSYTTPKIADMFFISTATVNNHRAKIMEKLNIRGRNQLLSIAFSLRPYFA